MPYLSGGFTSTNVDVRDLMPLRICKGRTSGTQACKGVQAEAVAVKLPNGHCLSTWLNEIKQAVCKA